MDIDIEMKIWIKGRTNVGEGESSEPAYVGKLLNSHINEKGSFMFSTESTQILL